MQRNSITEYSNIHIRCTKNELPLLTVTLSTNVSAAVTIPSVIPTLAVPNRDYFKLAVPASN